jgi:YD repeat-containing protein
MTQSPDLRVLTEGNAGVHALDPAKPLGKNLKANFSKIADQAQLADQAVGIARIAQVFTRPAGGVSISRSGSDYYLWHGLGGGLFSRYQLKNYTANAGNLPLRQLAGLDTVRAMLDSDDLTATTTGTWTSGANAGTVGGNYRYSDTAGATMSWTSPATATAVGITVVEITNGGALAVVEVDGSKTAANALMTAQDVVDKGWYANTILVANGGTLAPTDRVMDTYSSATATNNYAARRVLAADLAPGAHTVKVTNTGYMRTGLTAQRVYLTGFLHSLTGTVLTDAGAQVVTDTVLNAIASAWEYAYFGQPAGTTAPGEMGNIHGWEAEISLTITVDGAVSTPADGARVDAAREILVTRVTQLRHTELGVTPVADVVTTYRLDRIGLRVDVQTTWNRAIDLTWAWLMFPVNGPTTNAIGQKFNRAGLLNFPGGSLTFTGANGDLYAGRSKSVAAWMWSSTGKYGVMASVPDHTTFLNRWANASPAFAQINDRSGNILKTYFARVGTGGDHIDAGTVISSSVRYAVGYFPDGAEVSLSTPAIGVPDRLNQSNLKATFAQANPVLTVTYNSDGTVASTVEDGVTTTFTYNSNGTVNTQTRAGVTRTFTYDANGNVTGAA